MSASPTVTASRSDLWPVSTTVGVYPMGAIEAGGVSTVPRAVAIATGVVDAAGALSITNAGILRGTTYALHATVNGEQRMCRCRSTLDITDSGRGTGTGDTTINTTGLANVAVATGAFAIGQRVSGPGIPPGTFLIAGSGASWTMSDKATASASTVALEGHGASPAVAGGKNGGGGATLIPVQSTRWRARVMQIRSAMGTS